MVCAAEEGLSLESMRRNWFGAGPARLRHGLRGRQLLPALASVLIVFSFGRPAMALLLWTCRHLNTAAVPILVAASALTGVVWAGRAMKRERDDAVRAWKLEGIRPTRACF